MEDDVGDTLRRGRDGRLSSGGRGQGHSDSCLADVDCRKPNQQCQRRDDFKVDECLDAHPANLAQIRVARDANDQRRKQKWRDDGLDETQKDKTEQPQIDRDARPVVADFSTDRHCDEDTQQSRRAGCLGSVIAISDLSNPRRPTTAINRSVDVVPKAQCQSPPRWPPPRWRNGSA